MLVFWISPPYDQASPCLVDLVTWNPRLQNGKSCIVRFTGSLDHLLHSLRHSSRADKIVSLNIATIPVVFHAKIQLDKITFFDSSSVVPHVSHRRVTNHD